MHARTSLNPPIDYHSLLHSPQRLASVRNSTTAHPSFPLRPSQSAIRTGLVPLSPQLGFNPRAQVHLRISAHLALASTEPANRIHLARASVPLSPVPVAPLIVFHVCLKLTRRSFFALSSSTSRYFFICFHVRTRLAPPARQTLGSAEHNFPRPNPRFSLPIRSSSTNRDKSLCRATRPAANYLNARNACAQLRATRQASELDIGLRRRSKCSCNGEQFPPLSFQPLTLDRGCD